MTKEDHWEQIYSTKPIKQLGWYEPHLQTSLNWIKELNFSLDAPIIDVGGGASTLVDDLLDEGYQAITVFDISKKALSLAKVRVILPLIDMNHYLIWITISQGLWITAFLIFVITYAPMLIRPRIDSQFGWFSPLDPNYE